MFKKLIKILTSNTKVSNRRKQYEQAAQQYLNKLRREDW